MNTADGRGKLFPGPHSALRARRAPLQPTTGLLERAERCILDALANGPKTPGQLLGFYLRGPGFDHVKASLRDEAIESLLQQRKVRLTTVVNRYHPLLRMPGVELAPIGEGVDRG